MAAAKSTEGSTKKKRGNPQNLIPWKPGQSGNPAGRRLGQRNRKTVIMEAIRRLAETNGRDAEDIEEAIQYAAIEAAIRKGSFLHYAELSNGLYGKITDKLDLTSDGKSLAELIAAAHARRAKSKAGGTAKSGGTVRKGAGPGSRNPGPGAH